MVLKGTSHPVFLLFKKEKRNSAQKACTSCSGTSYIDVPSDILNKYLQSDASETELNISVNNGSELF
jgi:hypothetical protein